MKYVAQLVEDQTVRKFVGESMKLKLAFNQVKDKYSETEQKEAKARIVYQMFDLEGILKVRLRVSTCLSPNPETRVRNASH